MGSRPPDEESYLITSKQTRFSRFVWAFADSVSAHSVFHPHCFHPHCFCPEPNHLRTEMKDPRPEKVAVVDELKQKFADSDGTILTEYRGLNVSAMAELRRALREAGGEYKIYKNTLVRLAARDSGLDIEDLLVGPTALAFVGERPDGSDGDVAAVAKALREFAKTNQMLVLKGGVLGNKPLNSDNIKALAALPPHDVLLAQIAGAFAAPMAKFASLLSAVPTKFAYALNALIEDRGGGEGTTDESTTDETPAEDAVATESHEAQTQTETQAQTQASADADAGNAGESGEASQEKEA